MDTGFLHLHTTSVILFLLLYLFKVLVLFFAKPEVYQNVREKTRVVEIVFGTLLLLSGGYLVFKQGHPDNWLIVKFVLLLAFIPTGIIALRNARKGLSIVALIGFFYLYALSETRSITLKKPNYLAMGAKDGADNMILASKIYENECTRCHGDNGDAMLFGSKNLKESTLSIPEVVSIIDKGKGSMPAFGDRLSKEQIQALAQYLEAFKSKKI